MSLNKYTLSSELYIKGSELKWIVYVYKSSDYHEFDTPEDTIAYLEEVYGDPMKRIISILKVNPVCQLCDPVDEQLVCVEAVKKIDGYLSLTSVEMATSPNTEPCIHGTLPRYLFELMMRDPNPFDISGLAHNQSED